MSKVHDMCGPDPAFTDWNRRVIECMNELITNDTLHRIPRSSGAMADAKVPYLMGWSPLRTARAMLFLDPADALAMRKAAFGERWNDRAHEEVQKRKLHRQNNPRTNP